MTCQHLENKKWNPAVKVPKALRSGHCYHQGMREIRIILHQCDYLSVVYVYSCLICPPLCLFFPLTVSSLSAIMVLNHL